MGVSVSVCHHRPRRKQVWDALILAMGHELGKGAASRWSEYLAMLPLQPDSECMQTPLFWPAEYASLLSLHRYMPSVGAFRHLRVAAHYGASRPRVSPNVFMMSGERYNGTTAIQ